MERETQERQGGAEGSGTRKGKGRGKVERKGKKGRTTEEGEKMDWGLSVKVSWPASILGTCIYTCAHTRAPTNPHICTGLNPASAGVVTLGWGPGLEAVGGRL